MISYHPICIAEGKHRFALEQPGQKVLLILGVNPSKADEKNPDPTMRSVLRFVNTNGYDGYVMINLSSERATNPNDLSNELDLHMHKRNLSVIEFLSRKYQESEVLIACGNNINKRNYLKSKCLYDIYEILSGHKTWLSIGGEAGKTKEGNPRHPLYASVKLGLDKFDITSYVHGLC
jgi:serine/threonine protein phosphatase 1